MATPESNAKHADLGVVQAALPAFGSDEHLQWLARRLTKNLAFRSRLEAWARLPVDEQRRVARRLVAEATQGGGIPMELLG